MIFETGSPACKMFWGNILLAGCCAFYLLWWILAYRPTGAVKGMKSGWLLIPAFILGVAAVVMIIRGAGGEHTGASLFTAGTVLLASAVSYFVLLFVTWFAFHRQVTTELLLIVSWTALAILESNALYGLGIVSRSVAYGLFAAAAASAVLSLICYVLYYGLDSRAGYVDGMIPLLLAAAYMMVLTAFIARAGSV